MKISRLISALTFLAAVLAAQFSPTLTAPLGAQIVASTGYPARLMTPAQVRADVALLRQALEQVHAGYDRYVPRRVLDTAFARLDRRAAEPMTDLQLYRELALLLATIRCNHTKAEYPAALERFRTDSSTHLPVRVRVFGKRLYVARSMGDAIARGSEILTINGVAAADIVTRLSRFVSVDGFTDFTRASLLESDADLMGSDLDHYWPVEFGFARTFRFSVRSTRGIGRTIDLAPITYAAWKALTGDTVQVDFRNGTMLSMLDSGTARLTVRSFVNYRSPMNADSLYRTLFAQLRAARITHLVLDLRENGGGSDDASAGLIRYLADTSVQLLRSVRHRTISIDPSLAAHFDTWGDRQAIFTPDSARFYQRADGWYVERGAMDVVQPASDAFAGRVSVLIGRRNSSGSTMLLVALQQIGARTGRLRLVGDETGGSAEGPTAGQILFLRLGASDIRVRIPLKRIDVNATNVVPGMGVFPDIDATESLADFRAGIDRALVSARAVPWGAVNSPIAATTGLMRGVLEYRDYGTGSRVTLPTSVHISPIGTSGAFRQRMIYDDGPGNTIFSTDALRVVGDRWIEGAPAAEGAPSDGQTTLRIVSRRVTPAGTVLVLRGRGMDDNERVAFRYTVTLSDSASTRLKEFRAPGQAWQHRHEYRFRRVGVAH